MASLRVIKKDIDYLIGEVVSDCWNLLEISSEQKAEEAVEIIGEALNLREELYNRVNHPDKENIKAHYRAVNRALLEGVDNFFEKISQLVQK